MEMQKIIDLIILKKNQINAIKNEDNKFKINNLKEELKKLEEELKKLEEQRKEEYKKLINKLKNSKLSEITAEEMLNLSIHLGEMFSRNIKTNQIRNFFAAVLSIKNKVETMEKFDFKQIETDILLLKPKIAYAAGRKKEVIPFKKIVDELVDAVKESNNHVKAVKNFFSILESIVAYHKFYGGKDN